MIHGGQVLIYVSASGLQYIFRDCLKFSYKPKNGIFLILGKAFG